MPRRFTRGRSGPKRLTEWSLGTFPVGVVLVGVNTKVLALSFSAADLSVQAPATIIRTRGVLWVRSDQDAAEELQLGAFGVGFVNETARALGVTAIPGPSTDALWDGWFVHQPIVQSSKRNVAGSGGMSGIQYQIDSKAMRKFEGDEGLAIMVENTNNLNAFEIALFLRILVKAG